MVGKKLLLKSLYFGIPSTDNNDTRTKKAVVNMFAACALVGAAFCTGIPLLLCYMFLQQRPSFLIGGIVPASLLVLIPVAGLWHCRHQNLTFYAITVAVLTSLAVSSVQVAFGTAVNFSIIHVFPANLLVMTVRSHVPVAVLAVVNVIFSFVLPFVQPYFTDIDVQTEHRWVWLFLSHSGGCFGYIFSLVVMLYWQHKINTSHEQLKKKQSRLEREQSKTTQLLHNALPLDIVQQLQDSLDSHYSTEATVQHREASFSAPRCAYRYENGSVLFADIVGFTALSGKMEPDVLVNSLNTLVSKLDDLQKTSGGVEKIKTIGDCYMAISIAERVKVINQILKDKTTQQQLITDDMDTPPASGGGGGGGHLVVTIGEHDDDDHQDDHFAEMQAAVKLLRFGAAAHHIGNAMLLDGTPVKFRVGIHCGSVVAGVIGTNRFAFDLWGDTVNIASRMESTGIPQMTQVSEEFYLTVGTHPGSTFVRRGAVEVKGKGNMTTYLHDPNGPSGRFLY